MHEDDLPHSGVIPAEPPSAPGDGQTAYDVHDRLRQMILGGEFDDAKPFSQVKLAAKLGVSRTPLREALRMLEREGLVSATPNHRARVNPVSVEDLDELYGLRILLESLAASVTAARATDEDVLNLRMIRREMDEAERRRDRTAWERPHGEFHAALAMHAGPRLQRMTADLRDHSRRYVMRLIAEPLAWAAGAGEHEEIVEAYAARDGVRVADRVGIHLARTALSLITRTAPEYDPASVRSALRFVRTQH